MQLDERLYWLLALGILILYGPGPFTLVASWTMLYGALDRGSPQSMTHVCRML